MLNREMRDVMTRKTFATIPIVAGRHEFLKVVEAHPKQSFWSLLVAEAGMQGGTTLADQPFGWMVRDTITGRIHSSGLSSLRDAYAAVGLEYPGVIETHGVGFSVTGDLEDQVDDGIF